MSLVYDLSAQAPRYRRLVRGLRWLVVGAAAFAAIGCILLVLPLYAPIDSLHGSIVGAVFMALLCGIFGFGAWFMSPPADAFEIDGVGLRFTYKGRIAWHLDWDNPRFWIFVDSTEGASDWVSDGRPARAVAFGWRGFRAMLSPEAYDAMLAEFQRRGLVGERKPGVKAGYTRIRFSRPGPSTVRG